MNISKLALIALLGSALMAFGCGDDDNGGTGGTGGTAGTGGDGGTGGGGAGGDGGTGGTGGVVADAGEYTFTCVLSGLPIPLPVGIKINADDPGFVEASASDLTTLLNFSVAPAVIGLLPDLAPDAEITEVDVAVGVAGGMPTEILHTAVGLPFSPVGEFDSDEVTTSVTPDVGATEIALSVDAFTTRVEGLPTSLVPEGFILLTAGVDDCGALEPVAGSGPLTFPVEAAPQ